MAQAVAEVVQTAGGRDVREIPEDLIDANPFAPREVYTPQMIKKRADDMRTQGQHDNIHVIPNPDVPGRFMIADGWTRTLACRNYKVKSTLSAEVHHNMTPQEAAWFGYDQNEGREQHCDLDRAQFYEKMIATTRGDRAVDVAERAGISKQLMSLYRSYAKLPEDVMEIIRGNPEKFGANVAAQLNKLYAKAGVKTTVTLAANFAAGDYPVRWLISQVQTRMGDKGTKAAAPLKHVRYSNGYFKQRPDGFEVSITVPQDRQESFALELEQLLDKVAIKEVPATDGAGGGHE